VSQTIRLSLIFHEVKARIGAALPVGIGAPIPFASIAAIRDRQALADDLRERVYALARLAPATSKKHNAAERLLKPVRRALRAKRAA
jgi:hypothetical protein